MPRRFAHHHHHHRGGPAARCRWWRDDGEGFEVHARVERFVEPALLLLLRDGETHGYDLADSLGDLAPDDRVDVGNLYRILRGLEEEGVVASRWRDDLPGRAKRTYTLTPTGRRLLDDWAASLDRTNHTITAFLRRYHEEEPLAS
jgi:PadR family transcriptional regulator, regulatory protein PadR